MKLFQFCILLILSSLTSRAESMEIVSTPTEIVAGETVELQISYEADVDRKLEIWLKDSTDSNRIRGHDTRTIPATSGIQTITVPIVVDIDSPPHSSYNWSMYMASEFGGNWQNAIARDWQNNNTVVAPSGVEDESLTLVSAPTEIMAGQINDIQLTYVANQTRDIEVWLKDQDDSTLRALKRLTVPSGTDTLTISVDVDADSNLNNNHQWLLFLTPSPSGNFNNKVALAWQNDNTVVTPVVVDPSIPTGPPGTRTYVDFFNDGTIDFGPSNNPTPVWHHTKLGGVTFDLSSSNLSITGVTNESALVTTFDLIHLDIPGDSVELEVEVEILAEPGGGDQLFRFGLVDSSGTPLTESLIAANDHSTVLADDLAYGVALAVTSGSTALFAETGTNSGLLQGTDLTSLATDGASALVVGQKYTLSLNAERIDADTLRLIFSKDGTPVMSEDLRDDLIVSFDSVVFTSGSAALNYKLDNVIITSYDQNAIYNRYSNYPRYLEAKRYNVVFIAVDDLKPMGGLFEDFNHHSSIKFPNAITPNMDKLADEGMNFRNNYCQVAVCGASRISTLTGLRPDSTLSWNYGDVLRDLRPDVVTLPQHFGANGYRTHSIGKIFHHEDETSWNDGYNRPSAPHYFYQSPAAEIEDGTHPTVNGFRGWNAYSTDAGEFERNGVTPVTDDSYKDGLIAAAAVTKLDEYAADYIDNGQPFFLAVGFHKPHLPYTAPKTYWDLYDAVEIDATDYVTEGAADDPWQIETYVMPTGTPRFTRPGNSRANSGEFNTYWDTNRGQNPGNLYRKETAERIVHGYLACVSYADAQIGRVLDALEASGVADDTIVVLWSDHGWHLADHKGFWGKHSLFEQATVTPMLMKVPGMEGLQTAGTATWAMTELVDIYPTLLDLVDLPKPQMPDGLELEGTSLVPLLQDPTIPWKRAAFSQFPESILNDKIDGDGNNRETYTFANGQRNVQTPSGSWLLGVGMGYSIRTNRYRYTEYWQTLSNEYNENGYLINRHVKANGRPQIAELYDYLADPAETVNLAYNPEYAAVVSELKAALAGGNGWTRNDVKQPEQIVTNWQTWKSGYLTPAMDNSLLDESADPDLDGIPNLIEYKLGTHPFQHNHNNPSMGVESSESGFALVLQFTMESGREDVLMQLQKNDDLTNPLGWENILPQSILIESYGSKETREAKVPIGSGAPVSFFRYTTDTP